MKHLFLVDAVPGTMWWDRIESVEDAQREWDRLTKVDKARREYFGVVLAGLIDDDIDPDTAEPVKTWINRF